LYCQKRFRRNRVWNKSRERRSPGKRCDPPRGDEDKLDFILQKIIGNIEKVKKIPMEKRHFD
jgi:hypothetical protein